MIEIKINSSNHVSQSEAPENINLKRLIMAKDNTVIISFTVMDHQESLIERVQEENFNGVNWIQGTTQIHRLSLQVGCLPRGHRREYHFTSRLCAKCWGTITQIGVRRLNGICCSKTWLEQRNCAHHSNLEGWRAELTECNRVLMCSKATENHLSLSEGLHKLMSFMGLCHIAGSRGPLSSNSCLCSLHGSILLTQSGSPPGFRL